MTMNKLSSTLHQYSTGWVTLAAVLLFLVFAATVLPGQARIAAETSGGASSPDTSLTYSVEELYTMAQAYGPDGRQAYIRARWTFDLVFPLVYTALLVTTLSRLSRRHFPPDSRWQWANLVPVMAMIFDYLENSATSLVMARYPATTAVIDYLAPAFTLVKWALVYASFGLLLVWVLKLVWGWVRKSYRKNLA
jgi:hypothetical protein